MSETPAYPRLNFLRNFTEYEEFEANSRGYLAPVLVEFSDTEVYAVTFYDIVRLGQDLEEEAKHDYPFIAHSGMIVLPEITRTAMENAVQILSKGGFFRRLVPFDPELLKEVNRCDWPPS